MYLTTEFLSTPSARRATKAARLTSRATRISIHALREEGDPLIRFYVPHDRISIHALREEGDSYFLAQAGLSKIFLSTPSARRATSFIFGVSSWSSISIHALREEGDSKNRDKISIFKQIIQHSARI